MATPEGKVKAQLQRALLKTFARRYIFMPVQMGYGASTLDYLCCIDGHFVAFETKAPGKWLTPRQEIIRKAIFAAGGWVFVVDGPESIKACVSLLAKRINR